MNCYEIYFSPTGGTQKVAHILAKGMGTKFTEIDMIKYPDKLQQLKLTEEDLCLIAVPSFGGRVPSAAAEELKKAKGCGAKAVLAAVYGNRAIDDTLAELQDIVEEAGFTCIAGIEAVAEHSLMRQFGAGRPDGADERELTDFAAKIKAGMEGNGTGNKLKLPGNRPYRVYNGVPLKPEAKGKCVACGLCAKECPAGAIPGDHPRSTDREKCISCMHCVRVCPRKARSCSRLLGFMAGQKLKKHCVGRKENRLYL